MDKDLPDTTIICLNFPFKIRFSDSEEMNIVIFDKKSKNTSSNLPVNNKVCYWCSNEAPLAQALLGHSIGEEVEYSVGNLHHRIKILKI